MLSRRSRNARWRTQQGSLLLLWVLTFNATVLTLTLGQFPLFQSAVGGSARIYREHQARLLAEAGAEHAWWEITQHNAADLLANLNGWSTRPVSECGALDGGSVTTLHGLTVFSCRRYASPALRGADPMAIPVGTYQVWVANYHPKISFRTLVVSRGFVPNAVATPRATQTLTVALSNWHQTFEFALASESLLYLRTAVSSGGTPEGVVEVDSYDSAQGAYDPANPREEADLLQNFDDTGTDVVIDYDATTHGDAYFVPGVDALVNTPPTGIVDTAFPGVDLPPITIPEECLSAPPEGDIGVPDGTTYTVTAGCHRVTDIWLGNNATLIMEPSARLFLDNGYLDSRPGYNGKVLWRGDNRIYTRASPGWPAATGSIWMYGAGFTPDPAFVPSPRPQDFGIYVQFSETGNSGVGISQSEPFYGTVYVDGHSPLVLGAEVSWTQPDTQTYHGAFVSRGMVSAGFAGHDVRVHYDEALKHLSLDGSGTMVADLGFRIVSWRPWRNDQP